MKQTNLEGYNFPTKIDYKDCFDIRKLKDCISDKLDIFVYDYSSLFNLAASFEMRHKG